MNTRWSLRTRLVTGLVILAAMLFAASATLNYLAYQRANSRLFDDSMRESAGLLMQLVEHEVAEHGQMLGIELLRAETQPGPYGFRFQVWTPDMQAGFRSAGIPDEPFVPFATEGFAMTQINGEAWRAMALWNARRTLQVQIAQRQSVREAGLRQAMVRFAGSFLVLVLVASGVTWWVVSRTVAPLRETAIRVGRRSETNLDPVEDERAPREVMPLIDALNRLLRRIGTTLASERRFTADAAHELRTPLAAIRANTQVLMKARDEGERQRTAQDLLASVDRGSHLVDQLLALARVDRSGATQRFTDLDLSGLVTEQVQSHLSVAAGRGITLRSETVPVRMPGDPTLLTVMIRNLIDNALRYGRDGGTVTVTTRSLPHGNELIVEDDGPGIPDEERNRVFERFHRIAGTSSTGSGLGLSIVQRVANLHGGTALVDPSRGDRGACIRVKFQHDPLPQD